MASVLVVDDDAVQLEIRRLQLEQKGHTVWTAGTGAAVGFMLGRGAARAS